jgi:hypothetical protein
VEHTFAAIAQMGGKLIRTIGQARANMAMTMMAACYNLKRLVDLREARVVAFRCSHCVFLRPKSAGRRKRSVKLSKNQPIHARWRQHI